MTESPADFAPVLGRVPSGLFILTVRHQGQETGMLASWVMQAGFEPPTVTIAVKKGRYVAQWLLEKAPAVLNVLAEGQSQLVSHFARGFKPGEDAFGELKVFRTQEGVPVLEDCLGHLECRVLDHVDSPDHHVFLAEVVGGRLHQADAKPWVHVRKNGLQY